MRTLITGGGSGLGAAIARELAPDHELVLMGRREAPLRKVAEELGASWLVGDITQDPGGWIEAAGPLTHLVNNAGHGHLAAVADWSAQDLRGLLEVHVVAPAMLARAFAAQAPQGASVLNLSSTLAARSAPGLGLYAAAKAGLSSLTRSLAVELAPRVRANALLVGVVPTDMTAHRDLDQLAALHPLGLGAPTDVGKAARFLLESPWITGVELPVDGGLLL